jgi:hypothetical protein
MTHDDIRDVFFQDIDRRCIIIFNCEDSYRRCAEFATIFRVRDMTLKKRRSATIFNRNVLIMECEYR